jgi:NAD(P)-dependent dehydrogenase (short-subunit alcohol dehydrogenase family)
MTRRVLVVGTTDGIGLAVVKRLVADGWSVVGVSRRASVFEAVDYTHVVADVASPDYRRRVAPHLTEPFDVCVYCAGIGELFDPAKLDGDADVVRVNLVGAVETIAAVTPAMIAAGRGHVVGLSSIGDGVSAEAPSYAASKAGLSSYLGGLALALRAHGVRVTNLRLGFVDTKMAKSDVKPFMITADRAAELVVRCIDKRPARFTYPKQMAALVWLLGLFTAIKLWFV